MKDARRLVWICCSGLPTLIVFSLVTGGAGTGRFESGMYDPNDLALFLVMLIPLLVFLFSTSTLVARLLILGIGLVCLSGIILSQSRGGFLALVTAVSMLLFRSKLKASLKFVIVGMICLVLATMGGDDFWGRISTIWAPSHEVDETTMATDARRETWKTSLFLIGTRPWGSGFGLCAEALAGALGEKPGKWHTAHNSYLQIGVELGVLGLVVFLRLLMKTLKDLRLVQSRSMSDRPSPEGELASMLEVSLYSFLVGGFFLSQAYAMLLYVMIALSLVLKRIVTADQAAVSAPGRIRMNPLPIRG